ncbi:hypothetical protein SAMN02910384_00870 [Pseudobutyrivibrio sp. ACV-2]|uniref:hypothetical protein n=1 Tax=Pseudobutyrivibrio sp. ACV-2 TaxID=1520801 RepID=UPI000894830C|nr:hypothetical protein [Pseudobutyrivibrio sp. ACV-2]SEA10364.1 hypothetical protein SAMN02910384_00870 [Pseudobutyrivibrio sp. ACV-2]
MIMENDTFKISERYLNMSPKDLKKEEERLLKELGKLPGDSAKHKPAQKLVVAGTTFLPYL